MMTSLRIDEHESSIRFPNAALVELLAAALGVPRRSVRVVAGATSRGKLVEVDGADVENIRRLARAFR